jgi:hypothetical protein
VTLRAGIVAVAAAVFTYLATWALLVVVCLLDAGGNSSSLPPPNSWTLRSVYLAVAILAGLLTFRARRWRRVSVRQAAVPGGLALAAVLVVSGSMYAYGVSREHTYLKYLPAGMSQEAGLAYGHQACDWLTGQRWGKPSGPYQAYRGLPNVEFGKTLIYVPRRARAWSSPGWWHWAGSTQELAVGYIDHLDAQHPGPLTQSEREQASVIGSAWFELCPFQQWVHRPVGGSS